MAGNQKRIILTLVLLNLLVYVGGYAVWRWQPDLPAAAQALLQAAQPPAPASRSIPPGTVTPAPARTPQPVVPATPTGTPPVQQPTPPRALLPAAPTVAVAPTARPPVRVVQSGAAPSSPLVPTDAWQTLAPGASVWYRIGRGGEHIDARLEAKPLDGMAMDVFAPGNLERPIGRGTPQRGTDGLTWSGGRWDSLADWLAKITNSSRTAVQYRVVSATYAIGVCDSISYWETLGGAQVYWTRCK